MKYLFISLVFLSLKVMASREMWAIQSYELMGTAGTPDSIVGVNFNIMNIGSVPQTVTWAGGIIPNGMTGTPNLICVPQVDGGGNSFMAYHLATYVSGTQVILAPNGFISIQCNTGWAPAANGPGGEGVVRVQFVVTEDRGAIVVTGAMYIWDTANVSWGKTGGGPFAVNGGRAF